VAGSFGRLRLQLNLVRREQVVGVQELNPVSGGQSPPGVAIRGRAPILLVRYDPAPAWRMFLQEPPRDTDAVIRRVIVNDDDFDQVSRIRLTNDALQRGLHPLG